MISVLQHASCRNGRALKRAAAGSGWHVSWQALVIEARRNDVVDDVPGVTADPSDERRTERVEEEEPDEVETGNGCDDAAVLDREPVAQRKREFDPAEIGRVSG